MSLGSFSVNLRGVPQRIKAQFNPFDTVAVIPSRMPPVTDPDTVYAFASFTGIVEDLHPGEITKLSGPSTAAWLGNAQGAGPPPLNFIKTDNVDVVLLAQFLNGTDSNGFTLGTTSGVPAADINFLAGDMEGGYHARGLLLEVASKHNVEFRTNPNLTVDLAPPDDAAVWVQDPDVILSTGFHGRGFSHAALKATVDAGVTARDYITTLSLTGTESGTAGGVVRDRTPGTVPLGGDFTTDLYYWKDHDVAGFSGLSAQADDILAEVYNEKDQISASVEVNDPTRYFRVGDHVGVWAPESGLFDFDMEKHVLGETIFPRPARVMGRSWAPRKPMSVLVMTNAGDRIIDVSQWVQWSSGPCRVDLGWRKPTLREQVATQQRRR